MKPYKSKSFEIGVVGRSGDVRGEKRVLLHIARQQKSKLLTNRPNENGLVEAIIQVERFKEGGNE